MSQAAHSALPCCEYDFAGLTLDPLGPVLGAEVHGVDLAADLDGETVAAIHAALLQHKLLVFRGQDISHERHVAFGRYFGDLELHPVLAHLPDYPEILSVEPGDGVKPTAETIRGLRPQNKWHADVTFRAEPSMGAVLRARMLPPLGGDTIFCDTAAVLRDLPADLVQRLTHHRAEHDILKNFGHRVGDKKREQLRREFPAQAHPVIRTHPETGEKSLFVNREFTTRILGLPAAESESLLCALFDRVKAPEYHGRVRWTPDTVVFWDNRCTQHYPVLDYWPHPRVMERVTIKGDRPF
jgi:taurine dioxygenase